MVTVYIWDERIIVHLTIAGRAAGPRESWLQALWYPSPYPAWGGGEYSSPQIHQVGDSESKETRLIWGGDLTRYLSSVVLAR